MKPYIQLAWDSEFFGFPIIKINISTIHEESLNNILTSAKTEGIRLAYLFTNKLNPPEIEIIKKYSGELVDKKLTYSLNTSQPILNSSLLKTDIHITDHTHLNITSRLKSLALQSGEYSRFKLDQNFDKEAYEKLYLTWLERSVKGEIAKKVYVYKKNEDIVGFITLEEKNNQLWVGLLSVDREYRGQSIGTYLMQRCVEEAKKNGYNTLWVATQANNKGACAFYEKNGFKLQNEQFIYHFWL